MVCRAAADPLPAGGGGAAPSPQNLVVDVGCGTGGNLAALAGRYRCLGIDTSAEAVELARRRFPNVQFIAGRAPQDLGELAGQAKLVLLMRRPGARSDDYAMFSELLAAASPGCHFLVTVPADESLWSEHDESFGHYRRYDLERLEGIWSGLPATTLLVSHFNSRLLPAVRWIRSRNRRRGRAAGRAGTDFWLPSRPVNSLLTAIFAGEARRLAAALHGRKHGYRAGASLVAVIRREPGPAAIRSKPAGLPPDHR